MKTHGGRYGAMVFVMVEVEQRRRYDPFESKLYKFPVLKFRVCKVPSSSFFMQSITIRQANKDDVNSIATFTDFFRHHARHNNRKRTHE